MAVGENALQCIEVSDWGSFTVFNQPISSRLLSCKEPNSIQYSVSKVAAFKKIFGLNLGSHASMQGEAWRTEEI